MFLNGALGKVVDPTAGFISVPNRSVQTIFTTTSGVVLFRGEWIENTTTDKSAPENTTAYDSSEHTYDTVLLQYDTKENLPVDSTIASIGVSNFTKMSVSLPTTVYDSSLQVYDSTQLQYDTKENSWADRVDT